MWKGKRLLWFSLFAIEEGFARKRYYWQRRNIISCHLASRSLCKRLSAEAEAEMAAGGSGCGKEALR